MKKKRNILDNPVLGYFIMMIAAMTVASVGSVFDLALAQIIPDYAFEIEMFGYTVKTAVGIAYGIAGIIATYIFVEYFKPDFDGCIGKQRIIEGLIMIWPMLLVHYTGSFVSIFIFGLGNIPIAFLRACGPGFAEEVIFRGLGIANFMRTIRSDKQIPFIFWFSSLVFGISHLSNALAGQDLKYSAIQAAYAAGIGMALAGVYLRTGNLWPTMIAHLTVDFFEFCRADMSNAIMENMGAGDWITISAGVIGAIIGLMLIGRKHRPEIMALWRKKWNIT